MVVNMLNYSDVLLCYNLPNLGDLEQGNASNNKDIYTQTNSTSSTTVLP